MATAEALRALEDDLPWLRDDFRAGLAALSSSTALASRQYAADARVLAGLAAQVPRCPFDETGSTPWTSFRHEVALARKTTDRAAGKLIRAALRLTSVLPRAMALLDAGVLTVQRATALVRELEPVSDELAGQIDAALADKAALLPVWRIEQEVRKAVLRLDPEAAAARTARKNAGRGVALHPDTDDQALVTLFGPAAALTRWYATVDGRARALKAAGDDRTLDALRFDLATSTYPCDVHVPADPTAEPEQPVVPAATGDREVLDRGPAAPAASADVATASASPTSSVQPAPPPPLVEPASADCRMSRPVQAHVVVPVETALGLSNEPGWLDGYGWISAPTCRQLLVDAELRRVCVRAGTGDLVDVAARDVRPPPTPTGLRDSLLGMVLGDVVMDDVGWRTEPQHDPSDRLRDFVVLRDRTCDGPTGARVSARRADLDHDRPYGEGPTAAWNLAARGRRTHQHKHAGWTPLRTSTGTLWFSPAGQVVEVPRHLDPPPGIDDGADAVLPDPDDLHELDRLQLTAADSDRPWLPRDERDSTTWTWLGEQVPAPF